MDPTRSRRCTSRLLALFALAFLPAALLAQGVDKRPLTHDDYDGWRSLRGTAYSVDGNWVAYTIAPAEGDGVLEVRQISGDTVYSHPRGTNAAFTADGRYLVFNVPPSSVEAKQKRLEEARKEAAGESSPRRARRGGGQRGQGQRGRGGRGRGRGGRGGGGGGGDAGGDGQTDLAILTLSTFNVELIENIKGFRIPEDSSFVVYHLDDPKTDEDEEEEEETEAEEEEDEDEDPLADKRRDGTPLVVRNMANGNEQRFEGVVGYGMTGEGTWVYFHASSKEENPEVDHGLHALKLGESQKVTLVEGAANYSGFTTDEEATRFAFTSDLEDFAADEPLIDVYLWDFGNGPARRIISAQTDGLPMGKVVVQGGLSFSDDASVLTFGIRNAPEEDPPVILPEDVVTLDLWSWKDPLLQTQQAVQANQTRNPTWTSVFHIDGGRMVVLGDEEIPSMRLITPDGSRALASSNAGYEQMITWDGRYNDIYLVNTVDGSRTKVLTGLRGNASASPTGRYLTYFGPDYAWHSIDVQSLETRNLTGGLGVHFDRDWDDHPSPNPSWGITGWTEGDDAVLINDEFDIWKISPATGDATNVTDGFGRANKMTLRYARLDNELDYIPDDVLLSARDNETMATGYYNDPLVEARTPRKIVMMDKAIGGLRKAEDADRLFFTLSTWAEFPNLWTSAMDFSGMEQLTDANPQQSDIRWGNAELVNWVSSDGIPLKGILVKPEGFDPEKKYPMMVYFYERMSQGVHRYITPSPGTSPSASYYVSNGYLWFQPDIVYKEGYPGPSAYACVVPGVQSLIAKGFVKEDSIGINGHSWGGYQTAFLVTRTNMFAAAESGAPVVNMYSAYGGIRWQRGLMRSMQYEQTQSRIGGSIWEYPMRYWENSPLFFADKVQTPVLMLHNDQDGAVPWYQGIEFLGALRRMGKEAYMFNYVGEPHGLRRRANQKDWARRMQEFFDHHLKGAPAPKWMTEGVPYNERASEKWQYLPRSIIEAGISGSGSGGRK